MDWIDFFPCSPPLGRNGVAGATQNATAEQAGYSTVTTRYTAPVHVPKLGDQRLTSNRTHQQRPNKRATRLSPLATLRQYTSLNLGINGLQVTELTSNGRTSGLLDCHHSLHCASTRGINGLQVTELTSNGRTSGLLDCHHSLHCASTRGINGLQVTELTSNGRTSGLLNCHHSLHCASTRP
ncbi:hypothetical protein J6590_078010 [Homalodisca vitripennis]|nr:hypothetical protein J6590_078010 [Homalodisca vitripennis]